MIFILLLLTAVLIGGLMPIQAGINAELTRFLKHPYLAAIISLLTGALALSLILLFQGTSAVEFKKVIEAPPKLYLGGILGAIFVSSSMFFIPRMGATAMIAAFVTGQLLMSVVIDHYGLLGLNAQPLSITRLFGIILLFTGLYLVIRKNS